MILFHGTLEQNIKSIKKNGLFTQTLDQWIIEVTNAKVCCVSNQPTSGEGGNASFFAYGNAQTKNQNGYLVVVDLDQEVFKQKLVTVFDNKILDDYVRYHFFIREEFRAIGYKLYKAINNYRSKDNSLKRLDNYLSSARGKILYEEDQKKYYRKLYSEDRKNFQILDITISDEFYDFIQAIGKWQPFYRFLELHFGTLEENLYNNFQAKNAHLKNKVFWEKYYTHFPIKTVEAKEKYFEHWFSSQWLSLRQQQQLTENCQILVKDIEPLYIKGFIHITTPSGFAGKFRSCRSKSGFAKEVWKQVHRLKE
ncbi:hypothetical protein [Candidatus Uabimicrobium sp. HlEnr_7]|uniref:hypothetical protein n=1 Tax=Candidatus Uabimicrobium helgolandensis TaxID=3095367 RepID=UPI003556BF81